MFSQTNQSLTQTVCAGDVEPYLINPPTTGSVYTWSLNALGGTIIPGSSSDNITVNWGSTPAVYILTVIETDANGCDGDPITVAVTVISLPAPPSPSTVVACEGGVIPDLFAVGSLPTWYSDQLLTTQVYQGNYYATGQTSIGSYTYYVTETWNGCEGLAVQVTLDIYGLPTSPVAANEVACEGGLIPDLTATGTSLVWYDNPTLTITSQVGNGSPFATGKTTAGVYPYYVTQNDGNGCESNATPVTLEIYAIPITTPIWHN